MVLVIHKLACSYKLLIIKYRLLFNGGGGCLGGGGGGKRGRQK